MVGRMVGKPIMPPPNPYQPGLVGGHCLTSPPPSWPSIEGTEPDLPALQGDAADRAASEQRGQGRLIKDWVRCTRNTPLGELA